MSSELGKAPHTNHLHLDCDEWYTWSELLVNPKRLNLTLNRKILINYN